MNFIIVTRMRTHKLSVNWNRFLWHVVVCAVRAWNFRWMKYSKRVGCVVCCSLSAKRHNKLNRFVRKLNLKDAHSVNDVG